MANKNIVLLVSICSFCILIIILGFIFGRMITNINITKDAFTTYNSEEEIKTQPTPTPENAIIDMDKPEFIMQRQYKMVCQNWVSVREKPAVTSERIGTLEKDAVITRAGIEERYFIINYNGGKGYVHSGFVEPIDDFDSWMYDMPIVDITEQEYSYQDMLEDIDQLSKSYPELISTSTIGSSVLGRSIPCVVFGSKDADNQVLIHAGIHGREYMSSLVLMKQLEYYLQYYNAKVDNTTYKEIFENTAFHIIPMVNPDGIMISQQGLDSITDEEIKKKVLAISQDDPNPDHTDDKGKGYFAIWKANANGVDLNRNFDAMWEATKSVSGPSYNQYKGPSPESEPETKALISYTKSYDFDVTLSYHTFGSQIFWYYNQQDPLKTQCYELAKAIESVNYNDVIKSNSTSAAKAGYKDWAIETMGIPSLTIELGVKYAPNEIEEFPFIFERNYRTWETVVEFINGL